MVGRDSMRLDEARAFLGVTATDDLDAVKSAYRKLAFSLHPDLHPDDPGAKRKFQRLNEAYLLLRHFHANRDNAPGSGPEKPQQGPEPTPGQKAKAKAAYSAGAAGPQAEQAKRERSGRQTYTQASGHNADAGFYFRREEVLQDLLKDTFARQVFEDIYRQVKNSPPGPVKAKGQRKLSFQWGDKGISLDVSKGFVESVKDYFKKQFDDEQTIHLPSSSLFPGTRIRVSIHHGLGNAKPAMVEITLPPDFVVGRPIRLKGMGRRVGPMRGDLYLRLLAK
jgi:molecular chaperone DnaJ